MGTDNFLPKHRFGFFPAGSVAWVISNENFMRNARWANYMKLRASYGKIGNDQTTARYIFDATYDYNGGYLFWHYRQQLGWLPRNHLAQSRYALGR